MGKKIRAAKASLVAAFLAAGGGAAATATKAHAASPGQQVSWGDPMIRFLKLDGFPAYIKFDGFAQLASFYKERLVSDVSALYLKYEDQAAALLDIYQKDHAQLTGILIGLEQYYKEKNIEPLLSFLEQPGAQDAYFKFWSVMNDLQAISGREGAFGFFMKETGIVADPLQRTTDGQIG